MKIIVIGAGSTGTAVAETLVAERNDVTIVDTDGRRLQALQDRLDLRAVLGDGTLPSVLQAARGGDADLLLAVTDSDHVNLCVCRTAETLFSIPTKIAILRAADYAEHPDLLGPGSFAVDKSICPERIFADYIARLIEYPAASQLLQFGDGVLSLATLRVGKGGILVGHRLGEIRRFVPRAAVRIPAIFRGDQTLFTDADTQIEEIGRAHV
jgi:trk system potassium uptake protein TrkA